jgi:single-strand DNA-binding protein
MANLNKVMLIGRLTRDPEVRAFANGGKVATIGFAVNNRKKNEQSGQWEDEPVWLTVKAFNRQTGRQLADLCEQYLRKGNQAYIEGHLKMEEWNDKNDGQKRQKLVIILDDLQFLEPRAGGAGGGEEGGYNRAPARGMSAPPPARRPEPAPAGGGGYDDGPEPMDSGPPPGAAEGDDIPF